MRHRPKSQHSFDLFISYSHSADQELAPELQRLIYRVGLPWYRRSSLRVYRDQTNLPLAASLWGAIESALERSGTFVLLASPGAAKSPWVAREVDYWRHRRRSDTFWIVLTSGEIAWNSNLGDFDWARSNALPPALAGWFREEPKWIDLRRPSGIVTHRDQRNEVVRDAARTLAASLYGIEKDQLDGEDERESRRARRTLRGGVAGLVVLALLAVGAALVALGQQHKAQDQARIAQNQARVALARQLGALSVTQLTSHLDLANLLAVQAFRTDANDQTRSALFQATAAENKLARYLNFGGHVSAVSTSGNGESVVVGLEDGRVLRRPLSAQAPQPLFRLASEVSNLAASSDGTVVVATDGRSAVLARPAHKPVPLPVPSDQRPVAVALSASGRTAMVIASDGDSQKQASLTVLDTRRVAVRRLQLDPFPELSAVPSKIVASDQDVLVLDSSYGSWARRRIADWSLTAASSAHFGVHNLGVAVSADGGSFTYTNGASTIPVWRADGPTNPDAPAQTAKAPIANPESIALSADGSRLAVADSGTVFVTKVVNPGATHPEPVRLQGNNSIDNLQFLGTSNERLVASIGDQVSVWDLSQRARTAHSFDIPLGYGCEACAGPAVSLSPDGAELAVTSRLEAPFVVRLDKPKLRRALPENLLGSGLVPPIWDNDGRHIIQGPPDLDDQDGDIVAAGTTKDRAHVVVVETNGGIKLVDTATGTTKTITSGLADSALAESTFTNSAAVSRDGELTGLVSETSVVVKETMTGRTVSTIPGNKYTGIAFTDDLLLLQRREGPLEAWDKRATKLDHAMAGDPSYVFPPVPNEQGTIVARQRSDSSVTLANIATGTTLTTVPPEGSEPGLRAGLAFSPDGRRLVTVVEGSGESSVTGIVVVREISDEALVRVACATADRNLTVEEWKTLVGAAVPQSLICR